MIAHTEKGPADHLVLVSIGNTSATLATWKRGEGRHASVQAPADVIDTLAGLLKAKWDALPGDETRAVVIGSVVPDALTGLEQAAAAQGISPLLVVGRDLPPPIGADVDDPEKVGIDRLCVAAAAYARLKTACVVADFGTALTIDLVADNGVFLGGTIVPGLGLCARALNEHTAQLPLVQMNSPTETLGKNTDSAIRNGIFYMMTGALREITERYATEIGRWPPLVVTGGDGEAIAQACDFVDHTVPDLVLDGLLLAYQNHFDADQDEKD